MDWECAKITQDATVFGGGITFMTSETVAGVELVHLEHVRIARRLRDNRGGGDRGGESVTANDAALWCLSVWNPARVDEDEVGLCGQALHRALHREEAGV